MTRYAAFLRAVNVGGTGKLPKGVLRLMCEGLGFTKVQTHIASGNGGKKDNAFVEMLQKGQKIYS